MMQGKHKIAITILICDDDEDDRMLTKQALEHAHIANSLQFVEDGEQLLEYLYQRGRYAGETGLAPRPGLILLDLNMPKKNGKEALAEIRAEARFRAGRMVTRISPPLASAWSAFMRVLSSTWRIWSWST